MLMTHTEGIGVIADPRTVLGNLIFYYDFPGDSPMYNVLVSSSHLAKDTK